MAVSVDEDAVVDVMVEPAPRLFLPVPSPVPVSVPLQAAARRLGRLTFDNPPFSEGRGGGG